MPVDASQLQPKRVAVNKLIILLLCVTCTCPLVTPTKMSHLKIKKKKGKKLFPCSEMIGTILHHLKAARNVCLIGLFFFSA